MYLYIKPLSINPANLEDYEGNIVAKKTRNAGDMSPMATVPEQNIT